jgi:hypothetical protein
VHPSKAVISSGEEIPRKYKKKNGDKRTMPNSLFYFSKGDKTYPNQETQANTCGHVPQVLFVVFRSTQGANWKNA